MLHILWSIFIGFIVGLIARHLMLGADHMGFVETTIIGIAGSVVGGAFFHPAGFFMSIVGAVIVLYVMLNYFRPV